MNNHIFISYRRYGTNAISGRIYDRLKNHFSESQIFMDVDSIPLGEDFVDLTEKSIQTSDIVLGSSVIIGYEPMEIVKV